MVVVVVLIPLLAFLPGSLAKREPGNREVGTGGSTGPRDRQATTQSPMFTNSTRTESEILRRSSKLHISTKDRRFPVIVILIHTHTRTHSHSIT